MEIVLSLYQWDQVREGRKGHRGCNQMVREEVRNMTKAPKLTYQDNYNILIVFFRLLQDSHRDFLIPILLTTQYPQEFLKANLRAILQIFLQVYQK